MTDPDAELDAIVAMLEDAALIESYTQDEGKPALRQTERGCPDGPSPGHGR